jgi:hypothetical protein
LEDSSVEVLGFKIYGSYVGFTKFVGILIDFNLIIFTVFRPWQPFFHGWGFNLYRDYTIQDKWKMIPAGVDVLVSPHSILFEFIGQSEFNLP